MCPHTEEGRDQAENCLRRSHQFIMKSEFHSITIAYTPWMSDTAAQLWAWELVYKVLLFFAAMLMSSCGPEYILPTVDTAQRGCGALC